MHRFKVGQKVVALRDQMQGVFKKGDVFTVEQLMCCPRCGQTRLILTELTKFLNNRCNKDRGGCGSISLNTRQRYAENLFAPLQNNADAIEYRLNVSIKELEVKEYQNQ